MTPALTGLIERLREAFGDEAAFAGTPPPKAAAREIQSALVEAMRDPELLPPGIDAQAASGANTVAKYLLHRSPEFVVFSTVTGPGLVLPPHDHGSWGVVGVYRGAEEEVWYSPIALAGQAETPGFTPLVEVRRVLHRSGGISTIRPPVADVHQIANRGDQSSVCIHVFRDDVVTRGFRVYAPLFLPIDTGPLEYDSPSAPGEHDARP